MKRFLISIVLLFAPLAPAQAYWEYGHETVAHIAQANMSPKARTNMQRLLRAAPMLGTPKCAMRNIGRHLQTVRFEKRLRRWQLRFRPD